MKSPFVSILILLSAITVLADVQQAWIQKYNAGRNEGTNQAVAMALDSQGNIIVGGSSRGANGDFDYVVLNYAPNGSNQWAQRYASTNNNDDQVRALVFDRGDNVFITGTSATVKYDAQGTLQWTAPYGGRALVPDTNGNVYVTGFSDSDFATIRLDSAGSNVWQRYYDAIGRADTSQRIILDDEGNVYVAGIENYIHEPDFKVSWWRYRMVSYDRDGTERFSTPFPSSPFGFGPKSEVRGMHLAHDKGIILTGNLSSPEKLFCFGNLSLAGEFLWFGYLSVSAGDGVSASILATPSSEIYLTGGVIVNTRLHSRIKTFKTDTDGTGTTEVYDVQSDWQNDYAGLAPGYHRGNAIGLDGVGNVYVAGQSTGAGTAADWQDWVTIKYSANGVEQWVKRYNGAAQLNDVATCMAVTPSGEVYVAGWSQASSNLTELVIIKYSESASVTVETNRNVSLQFPGTPGATNRVQATTDFLDWLDLGFSVTDPSGLLHFQDTNAPNYPFRFYRTVSP